MSSLVEVHRPERNAAIESLGLTVEFIPPSISPKGLTPDGIQYQVRTWDDLTAEAEELAGYVFEWTRANKAPIDTVVYVERGGIWAGQAVAGALHKKPGNGLESIRLSRYEGTTALGSPNIVRGLREGLNIHGKRVVVTDEVWDRGDTAVAAREYLLEQGASEVLVAVLDQKPSPLGKADFFVQEFKPGKVPWVVYPWEHQGSDIHTPYEFFIHTFTTWMGKYDLSLGQCKDLAIEIGFTEDLLPGKRSRLGWSWDPVFSTDLQTSFYSM